jgi:hypothetical protein
LSCTGSGKIVSIASVRTASAEVIKPMFVSFTGP